MQIFKQLFEAVKAVVFMPFLISKINKRSEDLLRIEKKIDYLSYQIDNLGLELSAKSLSELEQIQVLNNNMSIKTQENLNTNFINLISIAEKKFENQFLQFESLLCIYSSLPNLKFLPATRGWAGSPDFLAKIIEIILKEKPRFILEASSGVSTIIIGLAMRLNNYGNVISLDHERFYTKITRENIKVNEIEDNSNVILCPLRDYNIFEQIWKWYETDNLNLTERIDLLIIDGPPRTTQFLARYPAIPLLYEYFADRVLILLDDASRNDETIIVQKWISFLENNNFKVVITKFNNFEKGMVILEVCRIERPQ